MNGHTGEGGWVAEAGRADVLPLDWSDPQSWLAFAPPYDYLLAADCVYSETAGELLPRVHRSLGGAHCHVCMNMNVDISPVRRPLRRPPLAPPAPAPRSAVPHLLRTVLHFAGPRSTVVICNEFRSHSVHDIFMAAFGEHFAMRKVRRVTELFHNNVVFCRGCNPTWRRRAAAQQAGRQFGWWGYRF